MPIFNLQLTLPQAPTLLVHVGAPAKAYFSWPRNTVAPGIGVVFGGPGLTYNNGFLVASNTPWEPFVIDVPANEYLYAMSNFDPIPNFTMLVIY